MLPTFYYQKGKPLPDAENEATLSRIEELFQSRPQGLCRLKHFAEISKVIGLPLYSKKAVYEAVCKCSNLSPDAFPDVSFDGFAAYWNEMVKENHDPASRFIFTLSVARTGLPSRSYLEREDFHSLLNDIVQTHPGLAFDDNLTFFRRKYVDMVVTRIFWNCSRAWWSGRLTVEQLRKMNLLKTMELLEDCDTRLPDCFSYEDFYVVYSKFWDLDADHDMKLSRKDLMNYGNGTFTKLVISRIFSDALRPKKKASQQNENPKKQKETIGFKEFAALVLAEEDKRHPTAIEYWFRCLDLDGDGVISLYEMEVFFTAMEDLHLAKEEHTGPLEFTELACQLLDIVSPQDGQNFTLRDLKRCGLAYRFFDSLISREKYVKHELSEFRHSKVKLNGEKEPSDWEQFCTTQFKVLLMKDMEEPELDGSNGN